MRIVHLTASPFFGGPERQMLGLSTHLPGEYQSSFLSFYDGGCSLPFVEQLRHHGFTAIVLERNAPHYFQAAAEVGFHLRNLRADLLLCHGYKPDIIGCIAARRAGVPMIAVARGWTAATLKVRINETADRLCMHLADHVVAVSAGHAQTVLAAGVPPRRLTVIQNAINTHRFDNPDPSSRQRLRDMLRRPCERIVLAAGRLSPDKGFKYLIAAAAKISRSDPQVGFVLFGDGPLRDTLLKQIADRGLQDRFALAGFRDDVDKFMPYADIFTLPSFREGLPNVVLEASAAGVPVVATAVGGTPEVLEDGVTGFLVPPGDSAALAGRLLTLLRSEEERRAMGLRGRQRVERLFTFQAQSLQYQRLFQRLVRDRRLATLAMAG